MIERLLKQTINTKLNKGKAIIVVGARQVGKTTLIREIIKGKDFLFLNGDDSVTRQLLDNANTEKIRTIIGNKQIVFIDEAQRISNIGLTLKIITDQLPEVQLLVSGSSSFELGNALNEPLTGRKWEYELFPISWKEYENNVGMLVSEQQLENRILYGMYPDIINHQGEERELLTQLSNSYLYRDILVFSDIRKPEVLEKLLRALALQIGSEVNYNELSRLIGISKDTVQKYIDILEKAYIIFRLNSFGRNLRNEIKRNRKIYFFDTGIRNMLIGNFNPLDMRTDKGGLWENFLIAERVKQNKYQNSFAQMYFWRTKQQQEVDFVEEKDAKLYGYEIKWKTTKTNLPKSFTETYNAQSCTVNRDNFRDFINLKL